MDYELWLTEDTGGRLALLSPISFQALRVVNDVGAFQVVCHFDFDESILAVDRRLEVWRGPHDAPLRLEFVGFVRRWQAATDGAGVTAITIEGEDTNGLLRRRVVAYHPTTTEAEKTGPGDDNMKAFVRENLGALAVAARDLSGAGLTVAADLGLAPPVVIRAAWWPLLDTLWDIAADSAWQGTLLYFDMVPVSGSEIRFETFINQRGEDHSWPDGNPPLVFSMERGNLIQPVLVNDYGEEWNYVYHLGKGEGPERAFAEWGDTDRMVASVYNRCEHVHESKQTSAPIMTAIAQRVAHEGRPVIHFTGTIQDTEDVRYGRDWQFGDRVTAVYQGMTFNALIASVRIGRTGQGENILEVGLQWLQ